MPSPQNNTNREIMSDTGRASKTLKYNNYFKLEWKRALPDEKEYLA